jgi:hypothetical protein
MSVSTTPDRHPAKVGSGVATRGIDFLPRITLRLVIGEFHERGGVGAWLGTGRIADQRRVFRSYDDAVTFVRTLDLKSQSEWRAYCRGERPDLAAKPTDIPAKPARVYADEFNERGGFGAWLGTGVVAPQKRQYRPYDQAISFVHSLGLRSRSDWRAYCRGERPDLAAKPADIPADLAHVYGDEFRDRGGISAWLGALRE